MIAVALCAVGAEKVVCNELKKLAEISACDFRVLETGFGKIRFDTCLTGLYFALYSLRAVDRIMLEAAAFPADGFDALFDGTLAVRWENYIPRNMPLIVGKVRTNRSALAAETSIQSVVHKAAADRLCGAYRQDRLPDGENAAELRVYIEKDRAQVLLDLSGAPLFKRGYRFSGGAAPLRESTAAALILLAGWKRKYPLYDPFCGSGTIVIEAALYAWDAAPGLGRQFALSRLAIADEKTENTVKKSLLERVDLSRKIRIYGSDYDNSLIQTAKVNLAQALKNIGAQAQAMPKFWQRKMEEAKAVDEDGFVITNPPYGVRLLDNEGAEEGYRQMAVLRDNFPDWRIAVLSSHTGFETFFGANAKRCKKITNGAIETYFYEYDKIVKSAKPKPPAPAKPTDSAKIKVPQTGKKTLTYTW
jgi:putative N6-adenine-specific DNA methylase